MSAAAIIAIAIGVVVVLGALALRHARPPLRRARRRRAVGRDPPARPRRAREARPHGGRRRRADARPTVEAQGELARLRHRRRARSRRRPLGAVVAARPGGARRQPPAVLQPRHRHADERRPRRVRRRRVRRLPVADGHGRLRPAGHRRQARRHPRRPSAPATASSTRPRRARGSPSTRPTPCRRPRPSTTPNIVAGMEQGIVALYQKCPHLGCRVPTCATSRGSSARATARSTTASARRRPARRRAAWTASRSRVAGNGDVIVDTGTDRHRPADRHQHHRPGGRRPALHHRRRRALMHGRRAPADASQSWRWQYAVIVAWRPRPSPGSSGGRHRRLDRLRRAQRRRGAQGGRLGDRAGRQPQAVLRRRDARGPAPRARAADRRAAARRHRHRPAAVLGVRAGPPGRRHRRASRTVRRLGCGAVRDRPPTAGSTAPGATAG